MHRLGQVARHFGAVRTVLAAPRTAQQAALPTGWRIMSTQATSAAESDAPVRTVSHPNGCLTLTLHRPKSLNSLSLPMVRLLTQGLAQRTDRTKCVLVYGEGEKAFCAGGDIRALAYPETPVDPSHFFREEYTLNHLISTSAAPYVAIMRGITMGGGVGISVHGHVRVITDNTMFAMPETGIGLFPDVGGTYFLPRLPGAIGMYLALTGQSLGAADTMYAGVGTHFIPQASIPAFIAELESTSDSLESVLAKHAGKPAADKPETKLKSFLPTRRALIDRVFTVTRYEDVGRNLEQELAKSQDEAEKAWIQSVQKQLSVKSPTSLLITFECMQRGASLTLAECLGLEFRVATRISLEGASGDFAEGVKAVLIDKKHKPQWKPFRTQQQIRDTYFSPLEPALGIAELSLPK